MLKFFYKGKAYENLSKFILFCKKVLFYFFIINIFFFLNKRILLYFKKKIFVCIKYERSILNLIIFDLKNIISLNLKCGTIFLHISVKISLVFKK